MFKGFVSEVSKEVGNSAAIMINQLFQWWKSNTKHSNKIYRTNQELHEDLCGVLSVATIQRCKQKLIDKGYIEVSYDKGLNRVTHYHLTNKALSLLSNNKDQFKEGFKSDTEVLDKGGSDILKQPKSSCNELKTAKYEGYSKYSGSGKKVNQNNIHTAADNSSMKDSFDEYGKKRENIKKGVPDALKFLLKRNSEEGVLSGNILSENLQQEDIPNSDNEFISDEDYEDCMKMMECFVDDTSVGESGVNISSLLSNVFKSPLTKSVENLYNMKQQRDAFIEDY